jgi:NAD(P)-dependent dehydrogenase (short-subunit alcohol dehydrogenase family)
VKKAVETFGGIDIVINNASAISLTSVEDTDMKRYDLMQNINARGTFLVTKECLPYLKKSSHAHVLVMSPPLVMEPTRFSFNVAYAIAKHGMSMCVLGMSEEFKSLNISVNGLWPKTLIWTAAVQNLQGDQRKDFSRKPEIQADAAYAILIKKPLELTGQILIDEELLIKEGISDMKQYACNPDREDQIVSIFDREEHHLMGKL